ncbi:MAG: hypothetical protein AAF327_02000 [Cyanobacteria bacterium P01_A01_bin.37]
MNTEFKIVWPLTSLDSIWVQLLGVCEWWAIAFLTPYELAHLQGWKFFGQRFLDADMTVVGHEHSPTFTMNSVRNTP